MLTLILIDCTSINSIQGFESEFVECITFCTIVNKSTYVNNIYKHLSYVSTIKSLFKLYKNHFKDGNLSNIQNNKVIFKCEWNFGDLEIFYRTVS